MARPLTDEQEAQLDRLAQMPDSEIDYSDIPELIDEQVSNFRPARESNAGISGPERE